MKTNEVSGEMASSSNGFLSLFIANSTNDGGSGSCQCQGCDNCDSSTCNCVCFAT